MKLFITSLVIILFGFGIIRFENPDDIQSLSELAIVLLITLLTVSIISWLGSGFWIRRIKADLPPTKEKIIFLSKYSISSTILLFFTPILIEVLTNTYPIDSTQLCYLLGIIILGSKIKDNNCGFRAIKRSVGLDLFNEIKDDNVFGIVELVIRAQRKNYSIKEFPVEWKDNARKVGIKKIWKFLIPALKLMFKLKFEKN